MEITGTQRIAAPRVDVWAALNDPVVLQRCLPGCESVVRSGADSFVVVIKAAVGPLRARFNGSLSLTEAQPPETCVIVFQGQGGAMGFGKGSATVRLEELDASTQLTYTARAEVGGKLAQVGSRLIDSVARKMSDDFFAALREQLVPTPPAPPVLDVPSASSRTAGESAPHETRAAARAMPPQSASVMVPGWWLGIAAVLGACTAIGGALLLR